MFSIEDTIDSGESIELQIKNYSEIGHTHEINDVNTLQETIQDIYQQLAEDIYQQLAEIKAMLYKSSTRNSLAEPGGLREAVVQSPTLNDCI